LTIGLATIGLIFVLHLPLVWNKVCLNPHFISILDIVSASSAWPPENGQNIKYGQTRKLTLVIKNNPAGKKTNPV
jgi:hypothetical protein